MNLDHTADRRVPGWAAPILTRFFQDQPRVVTRATLLELLEELEIARDLEGVIRELRRLGWLQPLRIQGAWAVVAPGEGRVTDPYIELHAWRATRPDAVFALAGENAAWHLGYLDRLPGGKVRIWLPPASEMPKALRSVVSVIRVPWSTASVNDLQPRFAVLRKRGLDVVRWSDSLPAFGPDALLAQLAHRPTSFNAWADLVAHLADLASDVDVETLARLLAGHATPTWQRASYLLHAGGADDAAQRLFDRLPGPRERVTHLGARRPEGTWSAQYQVLDHVVATLLESIGKA